MVGWVAGLVGMVGLVFPEGLAGPVGLVGLVSNRYSIGRTDFYIIQKSMVIPPSSMVSILLSLILLNNELKMICSC